MVKFAKSDYQWNTGNDFVGKILGGNLGIYILSNRDYAVRKFVKKSGASWLFVQYYHRRRVLDFSWLEGDKTIESSMEVAIFTKEGEDMWILEIIVMFFVLWMKRNYVQCSYVFVTEGRQQSITFRKLLWFDSRRRFAEKEELCHKASNLLQQHAKGRLLSILRCVENNNSNAWLSKELFSRNSA